MEFILKLFIFFGIGFFIYEKLFKNILKEKRIEKIIREYENNINSNNHVNKKNYEPEPEFEPKQTSTYWEKVKKGSEYEEFIADYYKSLGYDVVEHGKMMGRKDMGIDIIAFKKNEILLIQCKNFKENSRWKIRQKDIKAFRMDCINFLVENPEHKREKMKGLFIASNDVFDNGAKRYAKEKRMQGKEIACKVIPYQEY